MNWIAQDAINLLMFLAPGLVAAGVFRSLTSYPPPSLFDQVVQALIFTIVVHVACWGIIDKFEIGADEGRISWTTSYPPYITLPIAALLAIFLAATYGRDTFHKILRWLRVTHESSFPSVWYSSFRKHPKCYVVLYLSGERYVYGWPEEWPSQPDKGHFRLSEYSWLTTDEVDDAVFFAYPKQEQLEQPPYRESILIPVSEVGIVEFMGVLPEKENAGI